MIIARNKRITLGDVIVPQYFAEHPPKPEKLDRYEKRWRETGFLQKIYVDHNNVLIDGFVTYLILTRNDIEYYNGVTLYVKSKPKTPAPATQPYGLRIGKLHITFHKEAKA